MWPWALLFFYVFDFFYSFRLELREKNCEDNREIIGRMKINWTGELTDYKIRYGLGRRTEDSGVRPFHCPRPCVQRGFYGINKRMARHKTITNNGRTGRRYG